MIDCPVCGNNSFTVEVEVACNRTGNMTYMQYGICTTCRTIPNCETCGVWGNTHRSWCAEEKIAETEMAV